MLVYSDDITGPTNEKHLFTIDKVLEKLSVAGLRLNKPKCFSCNPVLSILATLLIRIDCTQLRKKCEGSWVVIPFQGRKAALEVLHETQLSWQVEKCSVGQETRSSPPTAPLHPWQWPGLTRKISYTHTKNLMNASTCAFKMTSQYYSTKNTTTGNIHF